MADVVSAGRVTAGNVPAGLTPVFTRLSDSQLSLGFTGAASATEMPTTWPISPSPLPTAASRSPPPPPSRARRSPTRDQFQRPLSHLDGECGNRWHGRSQRCAEQLCQRPVAITPAPTPVMGLSIGRSPAAAPRSPRDERPTTVTPTSNATVTANFASLPSLALSGSASEGSESGGVITVNLSNASLSARSIPRAGHSRICRRCHDGNHHADQRHQRDITLAEIARRITTPRLLTSASASPPTNSPAPPCRRPPACPPASRWSRSTTGNDRDPRRRAHHGRRGKRRGNHRHPFGRHLCFQSERRELDAHQPAAGVSRGAITRVSANVAASPFRQRTTNYSSAITNVTSPSRLPSHRRLDGDGRQLRRHAHAPTASTASSKRVLAATRARRTPTSSRMPRHQLRHGDTLSLTSRGSKYRAGLLRFDLSSIPRRPW